MRPPALPRIAVTPGEPAGIGPDLVVALAQEPWEAEVIAIADPELLSSRAERLGQALRIETPAELGGARRRHVPGRLKVSPVPLLRAPEPGRPSPVTAPYVLETLRTAATGCLAGTFSAMVTGPVHKATINEAGIPFTGHTEFLAETVGGDPVMMLTAGTLRVALLTTHRPLSEVAPAITWKRLARVLRTLNTALRDRFGIPAPRIVVCGLNPHAGEGGHLGREEIEIISPALEALRGEGLDLQGPVPADTAFTPRTLAEADAIVAMYHDQGLPVLKHVGFGRAVNVTLGLPIVRTSVDHGTALDLAGTGRAGTGSLYAAMRLAIQMARTGPEARAAT